VRRRRGPGAAPWLRHLKEWFEFGGRPPHTPVLVHDPVLLRPPQIEDCDAWVELRKASRVHLTAWEPAWREDEVTAAAFRSRLASNWRELRRGSGLPLFVFHRADERLIGGASLSNIRYGPSRSATLGYWIGAPHLRKGYARAALTALQDHGFGKLRLNRIEAACQPGNTASRRLLAACGFREEGLARSFLRINGAWRDHALFAKTAADHGRFVEHPAERPQPAGPRHFFGRGLANGGPARDNAL